MNDAILGNLNIITLFVISISTTLLTVCVFIIINRRDTLPAKLHEFYCKIKDDIKFAITPDSVNLSPNTDDFIQFAIEIWRIDQRMIKLREVLPENQRKGLENSVQKFKRYLERHDIEFVDFTNRKFNEGLNLDVLSVEKDPTISESIIKETIEPAVLYRGKVIRKAKIIVLSKLS